MTDITYNTILEPDPDKILRIPGRIESAEPFTDGSINVVLPFYAYKANGDCFIKDESAEAKQHSIRISSYGSDILRIQFNPANTDEDKTQMLTYDDLPEIMPLHVSPTETGYEIYDSSNNIRARINCAEIKTRHWSSLLPATEKMAEIELLPDGITSVPLKSYDRFAHGRIESLPIGYIEKNGAIVKTLFSLNADPNECFFGTGERFAKMDLAGKTMQLENVDAMGVNSRRCYKNVPFYISSRPYGLFIHTSSKTTISLADISTRAAQAQVCEQTLDFFAIGGGSIKTILKNYCSLTGFAPQLPLWSYGIWMARMTYYSADEIMQIAEKMRSLNFPFDVMHIDTGWFTEDWVCNWKFSEERFPEPENFISDARKQGFRISLWQTPDISSKSTISELALKNRYIPKLIEKSEAGSDFSQQDILGQIDFSNPAAAAWYKNELLRPLLKMGVAVIKTDFGENIIMEADYATLPASKLRNRYALLYQKSAFEISEDVLGKNNSLIWARAAWAGCQRYPLHWGGDAESSWEGLAATLRGGLHLGLSGFTYWSHDVPGFHGSPDFMNSRPSDNLYLRWTQFGVFSSHIRYHGTSPREPYEHPGIADITREWFNLRYTLIPYIKDQSEKSAQNGLPMLRALVLHDDKDPVCRHIDSEYMFGNDFLAAPIMNDAGIRDIYLPKGNWIDFWTGEQLKGQQWLHNKLYPISKMPLFVRDGAEIPIYPEKVSCTDKMDADKIIKIKIEKNFSGFPTCKSLWSD
jgi:alpha-D-xyloside xylohydrolase